MAMTKEWVKASIERLRSMKIGNRDFIVDVCRAFLGGEVTGDELHCTLIELLGQADPETHMEMPVDAGGVPIHVGDRVVEHEDGHDFVVDGYEYDGKWWVFHIDGIRAPVHMCTHYHKPTVEDLLWEMLKKSVGFSDAHTAVALNAVAEYAGKIRKLMADE